MHHDVFETGLPSLPDQEDGVAIGSFVRASTWLAQMADKDYSSSSEEREELARSFFKTTLSGMLICSDSALTLQAHQIAKTRPFVK